MTVPGRVCVPARSCHTTIAECSKGYVLQAVQFGPLTECLPNSTAHISCRLRKSERANGGGSEKERKRPLHSTVSCVSKLTKVEYQLVGSAVQVIIAADTLVELSVPRCCVDGIQTWRGSGGLSIL